MDSHSAELLPLAAVASRLGVATRDLRIEVERGTLPHVRVGERGVLLDLDAVQRVLRERAAVRPGEAKKDAPRGAEHVDREW